MKLTSGMLIYLPQICLSGILFPSCIQIILILRAVSLHCKEDIDTIHAGTKRMLDNQVGGMKIQYRNHIYFSIMKYYRNCIIFS